MKEVLCNGNTSIYKVLLDRSSHKKLGNLSPSPCSTQAVRTHVLPCAAVLLTTLHKYRSAAERPVLLELADDVGNGPGRGGHGHDEAGGAEHLEANPPRAPPSHAALHDVHLDGEVDGERPERDGAQEPHDVAKEGEQHGDDGGEADEGRAPGEAEDADGEGPHAELPGDEGAVGPPRRRPLLDEGEEGLAEDLVGADEVQHDGGVGHVQQPEGLVEAEPREEVVGRRVAERRVPHAPAQHVEHRRRRHAYPRRLLHHLRLRRRRRLHRVLDFDEDDGVGVCEGDVAEGLEAAPHLLHGGHARADAETGEAALDATVGDGLRDAEAEPDGGVGEGHDGGNDGEPPYLVEVRYLREEDLHYPEDDHVRVAGALALVLPAAAPDVVVVEAVRPPDRPHADGGGDGVADGDADEVGVLDDAAQLHLGAREVGADGVHVGVVALAGLRVAGAVALGEERGGVVDDEREQEHDGGARHPAELGDGPRQREDARADDGGDDVGARRPHRARPTRAPVVVKPVGLPAVTGLHRYLHGRHPGRALPVGRLPLLHQGNDDNWRVSRLAGG
uniref:Uncharacterized protein n=1 Tax=Triticum urartu TaxID=4572 RepID=A0A8R7U400_TRIUA